MKKLSRTRSLSLLATGLLTTALVLAMPSAHAQDSIETAPSSESLPSIGSTTATHSAWEAPASKSMNSNDLPQVSTPRSYGRFTTTAKQKSGSTNSKILSTPILQEPLATDWFSLMKNGELDSIHILTQRRDVSALAQTTLLLPLFCEQIREEEAPTGPLIKSLKKPKKSLSKSPVSIRSKTFLLADFR